MASKRMNKADLLSVASRRHSRVTVETSLTYSQPTVPTAYLQMRVYMLTGTVFHYWDYCYIIDQHSKCN